MISNQILQNTIDGLKGITRTDLCVIDVEGKILAATFPNAEAFIEPAQAFVASPADSQVINGCQFFNSLITVPYAICTPSASDLNRFKITSAFFLRSS